jgi:hypothetical protein
LFSIGSKVDESAYKFRALVVARTDEDDLLQYASLGAASGHNLPVEWVEFPARSDDVPKTAVVSWRWDTDQGKPSENLKHAFRQAKVSRVSHLFIDIVSIDQSLQSEDLIRQVLLFANLYRAVPVIAAYDKKGDDFDMTVERPWIWLEANNFRNNPYKITYVGHNRQGCAEMPYPTDEAIKRWGRKSYMCFHHKLDLVWGFGLSQTIFGLLFKKVEMISISDLKFIMPVFAPILTIAYQKLSREDYLLTAAILCKTKDDDTLVTDGYKYEFQTLKFDRYSLNNVTPSKNPDPETEICIDGRRIAIMTEWISLLGLLPGSCFLEPVPKAEQIMSAALGITDADYAEYEAHKLAIPDPGIWSKDKAGPVPEVEIVDVSLPWL